MKSLPTGPTGGTEVAISIAGPVVFDQTFHYTNGLPTANYTLNDTRSDLNGNGTFDEPDLGTQPMRVWYTDQVTEIKQGRLDGALDFDDGRVQFGVETRKLEMSQKDSENYFPLGDWGIANPGEIPADLVQRFNYAGQFEDFDATGGDTNGWKGNGQALAEWAAQQYGQDLTYNRNFRQNNQVEEDTDSVYFQVALHGELGGMPTNFLVGARYEVTDVQSTSQVLVPTAIRWTDNNDYTIDLAPNITPLSETTSYNHLLPSMSGITRLMQLFPFNGITQSFVDQYNTLTRVELEKIRDFIVLHYHLNQRVDSPFWRYCREMQIPDSLAQRISMFKEYAHAYQADGELFRVDSWTQVMFGQGIMPEHYHQSTRAMKEKDLTQFLSTLRTSISQAVARLPSHQEFVNQYCKAAHVS